MIWGFTAKVDQTITVTSRLEPQGSVEEVDAPVTGVVSQVFVRGWSKCCSGHSAGGYRSRGLAGRRKAVETTIQLLKAQNNSLQRILALGQIHLCNARYRALLSAGMDPSLREKITTAVEQTRQTRSRLRQIDERILKQGEKLSELTESISENLRPLYESGGFARVQYLQQLNAVQEQSAELAMLREERSSTLGGVAGQINANNRD